MSNGEVSCSSIFQISAHATDIFGLIHTNVWGPAPVLSTHGYRYYVSFLDDFSRFVWVYPLKLKSNAHSAVLHFIRMVRNQFNTTIRILQSDNGGEYFKIHQLWVDMGIITRLACPYTSAQNGRAERKHRHIVETGLTLMAQASLPLSFW